MSYLKLYIESSKGLRKPPLPVSRESKFAVPSLKNLKCEAKISVSPVTRQDRRPLSSSPSRGFIPLHLVSSSNLNISANIQQELVIRSQERKKLATKIRKDSFISILGVNSNNSSRNLSMVSSKENLSSENSIIKDNKEWRIGRQKIVTKIENNIRKETSNEIFKTCCSDTTVEDTLREMDAEEIEKSFQKISQNLDIISNNIQKIIHSSKTPIH